ncbi:Lysine histidine transporter 1 [Vitis vinifera]|uniref:Lysine histidine transporter 1 n=1 Tax=Vitis vinifera TaxID=29760 RepID=A0A438EJC8_VITVI|nr:Lysine histidine transporter 1 [Vitis vinifera]
MPERGPLMIGFRSLSSRNAKWWYSAFHNVTAMAELGWSPGVVILVFSWIITLYTLWQMVEMHEMVPEVGVDIAYMITGGKSLQKFHSTRLGDVAFAYAGHNVVLEIQATIPSTPENLPRDRSLLTVSLSHWRKPRWLIAAADLFVVIHVIGSYQIYAMPVFDMLETLLVKKLHFTPCFRLRLITRTLYVAFTMFIAMLIPFFGSLLGFLGGLVFAPTTYFICIVLGVILMILAPIGALKTDHPSSQDLRIVLMMIFPSQ